MGSMLYSIFSRLLFLEVNVCLFSSCTLCPKRFTRKEHLKRHQQVHINRQERERDREAQQSLAHSHRAHFLADAKEVIDGPEQIEVSVQILPSEKIRDSREFLSREDIPQNSNKKKRRFLIWKFSRFTMKRFSIRKMKTERLKV